MGWFGSFLARMGIRLVIGLIIVAVVIAVKACSSE